MSLTFRRVVAYIFDVLIVSLIAGLLSSTPLNPNYEAILEMNEEFDLRAKEFEDSLMDLELDDETNNNTQNFISFYQGYIWNITKLSFYELIISGCVIFIYFIVFVYFFEGETVGKRIMRLKITSRDNLKPKIGSLLIRSLILYRLPFNILNLILSLSLNINYFFRIYTLLYFLALILDLIIIVTTVRDKEKRGLHDKLANTVVVLNERN